MHYGAILIAGITKYYVQRGTHFMLKVITKYHIHEKYDNEIINNVIIRFCFIRMEHIH